MTRLKEHFIMLNALKTQNYLLLENIGKTFLNCNLFPAFLAKYHSKVLCQSI
jgi:hypothetical protein